MRRLCLIIFVIPAPAEAAAGFDVPAVDLNWGRFPSHPPSASQPGRRKRRQRLHTPLGRTRFTLAPLAHTTWHTNKHTHSYSNLRAHIFMSLCICCHTNLHPPTSPLRSVQLRRESVGGVKPLIGGAFIGVLSVWWAERAYKACLAIVYGPILKAVTLRKKDKLLQPKLIVRNSAIKDWRTPHQEVKESTVAHFWADCRRSESDVRPNTKDLFQIKRHDC